MPRPEPIAPTVAEVRADTAQVEALHDALAGVERATTTVIQAVAAMVDRALARVAELDLTSHGVRIGQSLATGLRAQIPAVAAAAAAMAVAISSALPSSARVSVDLAGPAVAGARAAGGPVERGLTYWVGERGPELFTAPATGRIIDSATSRAMTRQARIRDVAQPQLGPSAVRNWRTSDEPAPVRARPATTGSINASGGDGSISISAPATYTITGGDPAAIQRQIKIAHEDLQRRILGELERRSHNADRRRIG